MKVMPENLKYAQTHEWARLEAGQIVRVGITDFAQSELGDIVFIGLPEVGRAISCNEQIAVVESVKTASDLFSPVSGTGGGNQHRLARPTGTGQRGCLSRIGYFALKPIIRRNWSN